MARLFSDREIRAVAVFLPLAGLLIVALLLLRPKADPEAARQIEREFEQPVAPDSIVMRPFDPNTVAFEELRQLGLSKYEAVSLLKYRAGGKVFRIPEELTLCYAISDSLYRRLEPWIRIGRKYAIAPREYRSGRIIADPLPAQPFRIDTVTETLTGLYQLKPSKAYFIYLFVFTYKHQSLSSSFISSVISSSLTLPPFFFPSLFTCSFSYV